jgi:hypothetical protein
VLADGNAVTLGTLLEHCAHWQCGTPWLRRSAPFSAAHTNMGRGIAWVPPACTTTTTNNAQAAFPALQRSAGVSEDHAPFPPND